MTARLNPDYTRRFWSSLSETEQDTLVAAYADAGFVPDDTYTGTVYSLAGRGLVQGIAGYANGRLGTYSLTSAGAQLVEDVNRQEPS